MYGARHHHEAALGNAQDAIRLWLDTARSSAIRFLSRRGGA